MSTSSILTIRPEGRPQGRVHIVFRSRPNYTLCGVRLVGKWTPAGDDPSSDRVCAKCRESYARQAQEEEAKWAAWQGGEARPGRLPEGGEAGP
jgi:hypothetical protein